MLDAEEVRGSNPLAPTTKGPWSQGLCSSEGRPDEGLKAPEVERRVDATRRDASRAVAWR
jgi:hypothetical protein